ncbi:hypothetical protein JCM8097_001699 [Rhodosporidiobolus ruineniae]
MLRRWPQIKAGNTDVSEHHLYKFLTDHSKLDYNTYDCCINVCIAYTGRHAGRDMCIHCKEPRLGADGRPRNRMFYFKPAQQLQGLFRSPDYATLCQYRAQYVRDPVLLRDIFDGDLYGDQRKAKVKVGDETLAHYFYSDPSDVAFGLLVDGFQLFDDNKHDCWPIIAINFNLPPEERYKTENVIPIALIPGRNKPTDFDSFLFPFVEDSWDWARDGTRIYDAARGQFVQQRIYVLSVSGDMPAMAMVMAMKGHGGICACRDCEMHGLQAPNKKYYHPLSSPPNNPAKRPSYTPSTLPLRNDTAWRDKAKEIDEASSADIGALRTEYGINQTPLISFVPGIDMVRSFAMELMHLMLENIVKNLIVAWQARGRFKHLPLAPWVVSEPVWRQIDNEVTSSSSLFPSEWGKRMPAPFAQSGSMTAEDYSNFLLHVGPVVLEGRLARKYLDHFVRLGRIYTLLIDVNSQRTMIAPGGELEQLINQWVQDYETLYYGGNPDYLCTQTSPVHSLLHAPAHNRWQGPLHLVWSFVMERYCQHAGNLVTNRTLPYVNLALSMLRHAQVANIEARYPQTRLPPRSPVNADALTAAPPPRLDADNVLQPSAFELVEPRRDFPLQRRDLLASRIRQHLQLPPGHLLPPIHEWAKFFTDDRRDKVEADTMRAKGGNRRDASWWIAIEGVRQVVLYGQVLHFLTGPTFFAWVDTVPFKDLKHGRNNLVSFKSSTQFKKALIDCHAILGSVSCILSPPSTYLLVRSHPEMRPLLV